MQILSYWSRTLFRKEEEQFCKTKQFSILHPPPTPHPLNHLILSTHTHTHTHTHTTHTHHTHTHTESVSSLLKCIWVMAHLEAILTFRTLWFSVCGTSQNFKLKQKECLKCPYRCLKVETHRIVLPAEEQWHSVTKYPIIIITFSSTVS